METPYFVYILRCADGTLYTGITTDPARRLEEHRGGKQRAKYTASHGAVKFEQIWRTANRSLASKLEYRIKRLTRAQKESLIADPALLTAYLDTSAVDCACYTSLSEFIFS